MATDEQKAKRVVNQTAYRARKKAGMVSVKVECKESQAPIVKETERRLAKDDVFEDVFRRIFGVDE